MDNLELIEVSEDYEKIEESIDLIEILNKYS
jgi:hypothetical protein